MGQSFDARCTECGFVHQISLGGGFSFLMLHCELCGRERAWGFGESIGGPTEPPYGRCKCGGDLSADAPPRCPKCRSTDYETIGNYLNYD